MRDDPSALTRSDRLEFVVDSQLASTIPTLVTFSGFDSVHQCIQIETTLHHTRKNFSSDRSCSMNVLHSLTDFASTTEKAGKYVIVTCSDRYTPFQARRLTTMT